MNTVSPRSIIISWRFFEKKRGSFLGKNEYLSVNEKWVLSPAKIL